jgi:hypothetical protein
MMSAAARDHEIARSGGSPGTRFLGFRPTLARSLLLIGVE